jgi:hypothetical protein
LELPRSAAIPSEALPDKKSAKLGKMTERTYLAKVRYPSTLLAKRSRTTKTLQRQRFGDFPAVRDKASAEQAEDVAR